MNPLDVFRHHGITQMLGDIHPESLKDGNVSAWLPIAVIAGAQVASQLIGVAGAIWQERARAASVREQMEAAASSGTMLCERYSDGSALVIVPGTADREQVSAAELLHGALSEKAAL